MRRQLKLCDASADERRGASGTMSALIAQAVELHQQHRYMPFWQCVELAQHLQAQSARTGSHCKSRHGVTTASCGARTADRASASTSRRGTADACRAGH
jgi:hypothetical protein